MRVVFMGTPDFAVPALEALTRVHEVVAVYTRPDAVSGRGRHTRPSAVRAVAEGLGLPVLTPTTLREPRTVGELAAFLPDVIVVAAYGAILPTEVLAVPRLGALNIHASLLPRWRGAAPVQRAILAGDEITGVSIMRVEEGLDSGPTCLTSEVPVDDKNTEELLTELAERGAALLLSALGRLERGECEWNAQEESAVTYASKVVKDDLVLDPDLSADEIVRRVRASTASAPARANIAGCGVTVLKAGRATDGGHGVGEVSAGEVRAGKSEIRLGTREGAVSVTVVKPDGRAAMDAASWMRGVRADDHVTWERP